jgi:hypothetical protein
MRRYSLSALVGLVTEAEDDDGQSASERFVSPVERAGIGHPVARVRVLEVLKPTKRRRGGVYYRLKASDGKVYRMTDEERFGNTVIGRATSEYDIAYKVPSNGEYGSDVRDIIAISEVPPDQQTKEPPV